jgi:Cu-Zn family superoxide dismutase
VISLIHCGNAHALADILGNGIRGRVRFSQQADGVLVTAQLIGLPRNGFFAFHIHKGQSCSGAGFPNTFGHFNPTGAPHPDHAGDLPPLLSCDGSAYLSCLTNRFSLEDVLGRTVVVHSGTDDFRTQPSGNPGEKLACGIIRKC